MHAVYDVGPFALRRGDKVTVECTYQNDTGRMLHWGDSALEAMCCIGLSMYPAIGYGNLPCER